MEHIDLYKYYYTNYAVKEAGARARLLREAMGRGLTVGGKKLSPGMLKGMSRQEMRELIASTHRMSPSRYAAGSTMRDLAEQVKALNVQRRLNIRNRQNISNPTLTQPTKGSGGLFPTIRKHPLLTTAGVVAGAVPAAIGLDYLNNRIEKDNAEADLEYNKEQANKVINTAAPVAATAAVGAAASKDVKEPTVVQQNAEVAKQPLPIDNTKGSSGIAGVDSYGKFTRLKPGRQLDYYRRKLNKAGFGKWGDNWNIWNGRKWIALPKGLTPDHLRAAIRRGIVYDNVFEPADYNKYPVIE